MRPARGTEGRRGGYTLIELLVVNIMLSLLVVLIAGAWRAFGPLCVEVIARGRLVNEANIAAQVLYQDSGGGPHGRTLARVAQEGGTTLRFDYGTPTGGVYPCVVSYTLLATPDDPNSVGQLVRGVVQDGSNSSVAIARHVESAVALALDPVGSESSRVQYTVTFSYRGCRGQYTFVIHQ